jgi:hypothetical protein
MTVDEYRAKAREMRAQAARTKDPAVREQLLLMAADWEKLTRDAEELERRRKSEAG